MAQYYILSKESDVDALYEHLSLMLPPDAVTVSLVTDMSDIMPAKYIRINTETLSDVGLMHMIYDITKVYCNGKKYKVVKDVEGRIPLI